VHFHLTRRGSPQTLCLLSGWGFSSEIFARIPWPCDTIELDGTGPAREAIEPLVAFLDANGVARVSLLGWSLGALKALAFARQHPDRVDRLVLASLRPRFLAEEIAAQRAELAADPTQAMRRFYRRAFAGQKKDAEWFAATLEESLLAGLDLAALDAGLDELAASDVQPEELSFGKPARGASLLHGARDLVAPPAEIDGLVRAALGARLTVFPGTGHVPFLCDLFPAWLADELARPVD
jgi:3-oxoadipate enol-lactonase